MYKTADVARGKFTHRPRNDPEFYDGEYPFIQTGEVVEAVGELTDFSQTLNEKGRGVSKEFAPGTIIITIAGNIGDTAVATFPVYFPDSLVGITPDEETDERFLEHFLRYRQAFLNRLSTKTTQKNLNLTLLRPIEVVKPPLDEQKKIADTLSTVDNQIKKEKEYKNHLQRLKHGLMQDLLSGTVRTTDTKIEVPEEIAQYG
ncbi:restriction endonuclease subunit S [Halorubrum ezzemoulense]|uniref:restriction endonuclease subunit S n=1 Tax=Halorubrum ezzemoulense TaxID=337243 RepID=UPI002331301E|nr:restriction endonuclease subunit S [Halorubrum ezzemoulense]MDB9253793.1 restriction endonuclease subunit S [Halorubrum ezzemoulense]MDB9257019.1 restriction endonuclease subunit S [Halorubrum ezzemoulense]MDB9277671.1 restriction endonuclease subunit S [Halorubrum ezzemoulense]